MAIIDFRVRVPYKRNWDFFRDADGRIMLDVSASSYGFGYGGSIAHESPEEMIQEYQEAGITYAVVPGRDSATGGEPNDALFEFVEKYGPQFNGEFLLFPYIDASKPEQAIEEIERYVIKGKGKGVAIEPGFAAVPYHFDDERAYPVYQYLQDNHIPVLYTYSGMALPSHDQSSPDRLDRVAKAFPNLTIVVAHGGWPWTKECISIAMIRPNVYLSPDIYSTNGPGAEDYWKAARTVLQDKIIFESSYPILPIDEYVAFVREKWGLTDEQLEKVFYKNAARVLGLE